MVSKVRYYSGTVFARVRVVTMISKLSKCGVGGGGGGGGNGCGGGGGMVC